MNKNYVPLEPDYFTATGAKAPTFNADGVASLFASTSFLYTLGIMICVVAGGVMYARAGLIRMQASERSVRKSNEEIKRITLGLLGILSLFVIIYTFNRNILTGDVGLSGLRSSGGGAVTTGVVGGGTTGGASNASSRTCADKDAVIKSLTSQQGICGNATCTALSGCNYRQYQSMIESSAAKEGVDPKMVIVLMCKESRANASAQNKNPDGTYDCGLMQVNQKNACDTSSLDPATNIARGVSLLKEKISQANQVYQNIPAKAGVFASYNCCSNKTIPNAPSADCTTQNGFPFSIPKWACPINPGDSQFNMCAVKNYACDLNACYEALSGGDL